MFAGRLSQRPRTLTVACVLLFSFDRFGTLRTAICSFVVCAAFTVS